MRQTCAQDIIDTLKMKPHPEGGWYVETFRDDHAIAGRARSTAIFFLLEAGQTSHWHRVDAIEIWHWHAGAPLELSISEDGQSVQRLKLGADILAGERPQGIVPQDAWQGARSLGSWTLVGCTVAPGFEFSGFELAPPDWHPGGAQVPD
ncbi:MAG: cupin domain-containing protein [Alphaproteobacteria bacterium]|nr:cupin domain-containing protein [Alphaproteobacteria bacterium]